jgi:hypothetical protein
VPAGGGNIVSFANLERVNTNGVRSLQSITGGHSLNRPKIGQIMIDAGFINHNALEECLVIARQTSQPVGRVIKMLNYATEESVESSLYVQSLIGMRKMSQTQAIEILKQSTRDKIAVTELIRSFQESGGKIDCADRQDLGRLFMDALIISSEQYCKANEMSSQSNLLMVRSLLLTNAVSVMMASKALSVLAQIRNGLLSYSQGIILLKEVNRTNGSLQDAARTLRIPMPAVSNRLMMGEMLIKCGLAGEIEILSAIESSLLNGKRLGETLIEAGIITARVAEFKLELQDLSRKHVITDDQALFILRRAVKEKIELSTLFAKLDILQDSWDDREALTLLIEAHLIEEGTIQIALAEKAEYKMGMVKSLLASGKLSVTLYTAALDLRELIATKCTTKQDGLKALIACQDDDSPIASVLASMGKSPNYARNDDAPLELQEKRFSFQAFRAVVRRIVSLSEFKSLFTLLILASITYFSMQRWLPVQYNLLATLVLFSYVLMHTAFVCVSWYLSTRELSTQVYEDLESANQTKARLQRLKK